MDAKFIVFSDTHWNYPGEIPEFIFELIKECDGVLCTGDIQDISVWETLCAYTHLIGVHGNCDDDPLRRALPPERFLNISGVNIGMLHGKKRGDSYMDELTTQFDAAQLILFGHSHIPINEKRNGKHFFNAGSLTYPRGGYSPSYGVIALTNGVIWAQHVFI